MLLDSHLLCAMPIYYLISILPGIVFLSHSFVYSCIDQVSVQNCGNSSHAQMTKVEKSNKAKVIGNHLQKLEEPHDKNILEKKLISRLKNKLDFDYFVGDQVFNYKLIQRIDYLGANQQFGYYSKRQLAELYLPNTSPIKRETVLSTSINRLSPPFTSVSKYSSLSVPQEVNIEHSSSCIKNDTFCLDENIFLGGHGEIWKAHKIEGSIVKQDIVYILKRMRVRDRPDILRCAEREIHYGNLLRGQPFVARYVDYFKTIDDYWLIFRDEGISLQKLMYASSIQSNAETSYILLSPSAIWKKLRTTSNGKRTLKGIILQIIRGAQKLHKKGIIHRDIKPSNILLNTEADPKILLADFSSAVNIVEAEINSLNNLSLTDLTLEYAPPEVTLAEANYINNDPDTKQKTAGNAGDENIDSNRAKEYTLYPDRPESYDIWSIGILMLELILGTVDVFGIEDSRFIAKLQRNHKASKRRGKKKSTLSELEYKKAFLLLGLEDYCIYDSNEDELDTKSDEDKFSVSIIRQRLKSNSDIEKAVAKKEQIYSKDIGNEKMDDEQTHLNFIPQSNKIINCFRDAIFRRDPLEIGFRDRDGLDLLSKLLDFDPLQRISLNDAVSHPYFSEFVSNIKGSSNSVDVDSTSMNDEGDMNEDTANSNENESMSQKSLALSTNIYGDFFNGINHDSDHYCLDIQLPTCNTSFSL